MGNTNFSAFVDSVRTTIVKHSPEILTGIGIAGMITTTVLAVKATPKALELIKKKKEELGVKNEKLKPADMVKATWKCYVPAVVTGTVSTACLIGASSVNARRNAALATAYSLSETAMKEYREKVIETVGEKKERDIRDEVNKEAIKKNPVNKNEVIMTKKGDTLFLDKLSGRYFRSDYDKIQKAVNEINFRLFDEMYISLNEFYYELGLDGISIGDEIGWEIGRGKVDLYITADKTAEMEPCLVIDYNYAPRYDFNKIAR